MSDRARPHDPEELLRHGAAVRALAGAILGDPAAADDVAQETFLAAFRGGSPRDPAAWLKGIARNLARRWIRTEARRRRREEARGGAAPPASPAETAERLEAANRLTRAVKALPEPYRTVVFLRYFDGISTAETAARTGAPEATVKTRLRRALAMLREALDEGYGARAIWLPLLVRVARPPVLATGAAMAGTTALVLGGAIMAKKVLVVGLALALLTAGVVLVGTGPAAKEEAPREPGPPPAPPSLTARAPEDVAEAEDLAAAVAASRRKSSFRVVVRYQDGAPAAGATIRCGESGVPLITNGDGLALLAATGGTLAVRIAPRAAAPVRREVAAIAGSTVEICLPLGAPVDGVLLVGEEPAADVEVKLDDLVCPTDERGRFRFTGLEAGRRCWLTAGSDLWFIDPPGEGMRDMGLALVAPARDLVLRAGRAPRVTGRVVRPDGTAVARATGGIQWRDVEGGGGYARIEVASDGTFSTPLVGLREPPDRLGITLVAEYGAGKEVMGLDAAGFRDGVLSAGDLVLRPGRAYEFVVRGPDGRPVPGAAVIPVEESANPGAMVFDSVREVRVTDERGLTRFRFPAYVETVRCGAPGFGTTDVALPEEPDGPVEVTLPGGSLLLVRVRGPGADDARNLRLRVDSDAMLFERSGGVYSDSGGSMPFTASISTDRGCSWLYGVRGPLRIAGILPGVPFRLTLLDWVTGETLATRDVVLSTKEHRIVEFDVSLEARSLDVRVTGPDGEPLPRARVGADAGGARISGTTRGDGVARLQGLRGAAVRITVEHSGYVPFVYGPTRTGTLPEELRVRLERGRTVCLTLVDPSGNPVECRSATARADGLDHEFREYPTKDGIVFRELPEREVVIVAEYAGARFETVVPPVASVAEIVVPATGSGFVRFDFPLDKAVNHRIQLTPDPGSEGAVVTGNLGYVPGRERWELRLPAVLPGRYRVTLTHWDGLSEEGEERYAICRTGPVIDVVAGQETAALIAR